MGKEEKDLFIEMMKKNSHDPKAMAACVRQMLLQDKMAQAPKEKSSDEQTVIDCTKDILKALR